MSNESLEKKKLTPMLQQYFSLKKNNKHSLLFFRLGDFFEMFYDDAYIASKALGLAIGNRNGTPICGVPFKKLDDYLPKLVNQGFRVAVVDQIGDTKGKDLTERKITRIVTPGTLFNDDSLSNASNKYLIIITENENEIVLVGTDISTGEFFYAIYCNENKLRLLFDEIYKLMPKEILIDKLTFINELKTFVNHNIDNCLFTPIDIMNEITQFEHFPKDELPHSILAQKTINLLLNYIHHTLCKDIKHISKLKQLHLYNHLILDSVALKNLEIIRSLKDHSKKNTLFDVLDKTKTSLGTRLLKHWLENPLINIYAINNRLDSIEELLNNISIREKLNLYLDNIQDVERLMTKIEVETVNARDLISLKNSLKVLPDIDRVLISCQSLILKECKKNLGRYDNEVNLIEKTILEDASVFIKDGGIIKSGVNDELDELRRLANDSNSVLNKFVEQEKENTGIKSLKIGYNRVFGYYLEIRHGSTDKVPNEYIRKQTLANAERYITPKLKEFETKILGAQEKIKEIEYNIFCEVRNKIKEKLIQIQKTAKTLAILDVLNNLAFVAFENKYIRPNFNECNEIIIENGRHPLVEKLYNEEFVPNNTKLNDVNNIMIITGPNMAGKSTYMRQVALLVLMAQIGSFIPADKANICPVDRIFTRIGASDDLVSGQSTFMIEMNEISNILRYATDKSLLIIDELGRGTSTQDGISIAKSVVDFINVRIKAKTLFATHYHELKDLAEHSSHIENFHMEVEENEDNIKFLRKLKKGSTDNSYGIYVAQLAGLPEEVIVNAKNNLSILQKEENTKIIEKEKIVEKIPKTVDKILKVNLFELNPLEAMNKFHELQSQLKKELNK